MSVERVIRPSTKLVIAAYVIIAVILGIGAWAAYTLAEKPPEVWHLLALALFFFPIKRHIQTRLSSLSLDGDHLTLDTGFLSRSRRTIDLAKVQDVTVSQTLGQRLLRTGNLTLESAGEKSSMTMNGIDNPRDVADTILERSRATLRHRAQGTL